MSGKANERELFYGEKLGKMIRCETISNAFQQDLSKFYRFHEVLEKLKNGETVTEFPANFMDLVDCEPVYEEFDGFDEDITNCRSFEELPATVQSYIKELERIIECPITMLGVGPARDQVMTIK